MLTSAVGYTAAAIGTFLMLPQVVKSWKTKKVGDLSMGTVVIYFVNCLLWLTYGTLIVAVPVILANSIGLVIGFFQIVIKVKYMEKKSELKDFTFD